MKFECHITIDPILDDIERVRIADLMEADFGFRMANLIKVGDNAPHRKDQFFTAHSDSFSVLQFSETMAVDFLRSQGHKVRRAKIEAIITDQRFA